MLDALEHSNLFVVPLDDQRRWYRYHHLFADVLLAHLMETQRQQIPILHQRASEWYEQNGSPSKAIHHALAADDYERVAHLAELTWQTMDESFQTATWRDWIKHLPDDMIQNRPVLCTQYANVLSMDGELEASEAWLRYAERWLDQAGGTSARSKAVADKMVVVDEDQFRTLPSRIALTRGKDHL